MTIQLKSATFAKNKDVLEKALNEVPWLVNFEDPSIFAGSRGVFAAEDIRHGERFPVVMDPATRNRFAEIIRRPDGLFRVR